MSPLHVIKIGGSLLATPGAMRGIAAWLAADARPGEKQLLIAGGGPSVEGLRTIDRANPLPAEASHAAAVAAMDVHSQLLPAWLAGVALARTPLEAVTSDSPRQAVLLSDWLRELEPTLPGERLTVGWQTTSDAIAARLALCLEASLTILKRTAATCYADLAAAAAAGLIDRETPRLAAVLSDVRLLASPQPDFSDFPIDLLDSASGGGSTALACGRNLRGDSTT